MTGGSLHHLGRRIVAATGRLRMGGLAFGLVCGLAFGPSSGAAAQNPLEVTTNAFIVEPDGRLVQAKTVLPGQVLEYQLTVANLGDSTLPAGTVEIVGLVPDGTVFVPGSATPSSGRLLTEFSSDGGASFSEPPLLRDDVRVDPSAYQAVRWTLLVPFGPNARTAMSYRVVIADPDAPPTP